MHGMADTTPPDSKQPAGSPVQPAEGLRPEENLLPFDGPDTPPLQPALITPQLPVVAEPEKLPPETDSKTQAFFQQDDHKQPEPRAKRRWLRLVGLLLLLSAGAASGLPVSRYFILNHAGVRSSASVIVVDEITQQPVQHAAVSVGGVTAQSGIDGRAELRNVPLGPSTLIISEPGFSTIRRSVVLGWGSNPFDRIKLTAVGVQYSVRVVDALSGRPIPNAQLESETMAVRSNDKGFAMLTLPNDQATGSLPITVAHDDYRTAQATVHPAAKSAIEVPLMTSRKAVYISKQSGRYDLYASDADGQNPQVVLPGTGTEGSDISLVVSPDGTQAAVVSTRDKQYDADGYLLSTLTLVNVTNGTSIVLTHADQIQLIDWIGTRLIFQQATASGTKRHTINSYDYANNSRYQLAAAAKFNGVLSARGYVYYVVAPSADDASVKPYFYRINPDGSDNESLLEKEVWSVYRTGYDTFSLQTNDAWYAHAISTKINKVIAAPASLVSRLYREQPNGSGNSLWTETQNGQGILRIHTKADNKETAIQIQTGLSTPVRWLTDDSVIYRVVTGNETADYVLGTTAGRRAHKIADVVNTYGFSTGQ